MRLLLLIVEKELLIVSKSFGRIAGCSLYGVTTQKITCDLNFHTART